MSRKHLFIFVIFLVHFKLKAQSGSQYTQYVFNSFFLNPGAAGISNKINVQTLIRSQYLGYAATTDQGGGINSTNISADMPLKKLNGGFGIYFDNYSFSKVQTNQDLKISYSFHKKINQNILGLGLSVGSLTKKLLGDSYVPRDQNDPLVPANTLTVHAPSIDVGAYLYNPNYQLGLSVKNITQSTYSIDKSNGNLKDLRQYYVTARTNYGISYMLDVSPMLLIKSDLKTISTEIGALATYNQKYWGGINYRLQDAVSGIFGADILNNTLKMGYALDLVTYGQKAKATSSHEVFLRYTLNPPKIGKKSIIKTPRYSL